MSFLAFYKSIPLKKLPTSYPLLLDHFSKHAEDYNFQMELLAIWKDLLIRLESNNFSDIVNQLLPLFRSIYNKMAEFISNSREGPDIFSLNLSFSGFLLSHHIAEETIKLTKEFNFNQLRLKKKNIEIIDFWSQENIKFDSYEFKLLEEPNDKLLRNFVYRLRAIRKIGSIDLVSEACEILKKLLIPKYKTLIKYEFLKEFAFLYKDLLFISSNKNGENPDKAFSSSKFRQTSNEKEEETKKKEQEIFLPSSLYKKLLDSLDGLLELSDFLNIMNGILSKGVDEKGIMTIIEKIEQVCICGRYFFEMDKNLEFPILNEKLLKQLEKFEVAHMKNGVEESKRWKDKENSETKKENKRKKGGGKQLLIDLLNYHEKLIIMISLNKSTEIHRFLKTETKLELNEQNHSFVHLNLISLGISKYFLDFEQDFPAILENLNKLLDELTYENIAKDLMLKDAIIKIYNKLVMISKDFVDKHLNLQEVLVLVEEMTGLKKSKGLSKKSFSQERLLHHIFALKMKLRISSFMNDKNLNPLQSNLDIIFYMCAFISKFKNDCLMEDFKLTLSEINEHIKEMDFNQKENNSRLRLLILVIGNMFCSIDTVIYSVLIYPSLISILSQNILFAFSILTTKAKNALDSNNTLPMFKMLLNYSILEDVFIKEFITAYFSFAILEPVANAEEIKKEFYEHLQKHFQKKQFKLIISETIRFLLKKIEKEIECSDVIIMLSEINNLLTIRVNKAKNMIAKIGVSLELIEIFEYCASKIKKRELLNDEVSAIFSKFYELNFQQLISGEMQRTFDKDKYLIHILNKMSSILKNHSVDQRPERSKQEANKNVDLQVFHLRISLLCKRVIMMIEQSLLIFPESGVEKVFEHQMKVLEIMSEVEDILDVIPKNLFHIKEFFVHWKNFEFTKKVKVKSSIFKIKLLKSLENLNLMLQFFEQVNFNLDVLKFKYIILQSFDEPCLVSSSQTKTFHTLQEMQSIYIFLGFLKDSMFIYNNIMNPPYGLTPNIQKCEYNVENIHLQRKLSAETTSMQILPTQNSFLSSNMNDHLKEMKNKQNKNDRSPSNYYDFLILKAELINANKITTEEFIRKIISLCEFSRSYQDLMLRDQLLLHLAETIKTSKNPALAFSIAYEIVFKDLLGYICNKGKQKSDDKVGIHEWEPRDFVFEETAQIKNNGGCSIAIHSQEKKENQLQKNMEELYKPGVFKVIHILSKCFQLMIDLLNRRFASYSLISQLIISFASFELKFGRICQYFELANQTSQIEPNNRLFPLPTTEFLIYEVFGRKFILNEKIEGSTEIYKRMQVMEEIMESPLKKEKSALQELDLPVNSSRRDSLLDYYNKRRSISQTGDLEGLEKRIKNFLRPESIFEPLNKRLKIWLMKGYLNERNYQIGRIELRERIFGVRTSKCEMMESLLKEEERLADEEVMNQTIMKLPNDQKLFEIKHNIQGISNDRRLYIFLKRIRRFAGKWEGFYLFKIRDVLNLMVNEAEEDVECVEDCFLMISYVEKLLINEFTLNIELHKEINNSNAGEISCGCSCNEKMLGNLSDKKKEIVRIFSDNTYEFKRFLKFIELEKKDIYDMKLSLRRSLQPILPVSLANPLFQKVKSGFQIPIHSNVDNNSFWFSIKESSKGIPICFLRIVEDNKEKTIFLAKFDREFNFITYSWRNDSKIDFLLDFIKEFHEEIDKDNEEMGNYKYDQKGNAEFISVYWKRKNEHEKRCEKLIKHIEESGQYLFLAFFGHCLDIEQEIKVNCEISNLLRQTFFNKNELLDNEISFFKQILINLILINDHDLLCKSEEHLLKLFPWLSSIDLKHFISEIIQIKKSMNFDYFLGFTPVYLILDPQLQCFPFEIMPRYSKMKQIFHRIPSLSYLIETANQNFIDPRKAFMILNPGGDLKNTEQTLSQIWDKKWNGLSYQGVFPDQNDFIKALHENDVYFYFGHGSGAQFFSENNVKKIEKINSAAIVIGCSSARQIPKKRLKKTDLNGNSLEFLLAGSPLYMGCLWDIMSRDADKMSSYLLKGISAQKNLDIGTIVLESRNNCQYKYLNGASFVIYGRVLK